MDFAQTNGLSMIGNDDFVTEEQLGNYVTLDTTQTITGSKTFTSQIVGTGNINVSGSGSNTLSTSSITGSNQLLSTGANSFTTISATNNYIDATTATQLRINTIPKLRIQSAENAHINDSHYIRNIGETITYASFDGANNFLENVANTITATTGSNSINNSSGNNIINTQSGSNEIRVFSLPKITTTSTDNTLTNLNNSLNSTGASGYNVMTTNGANSLNAITSNGTNSFNSITALGSNSFNVLKIGVDDKITTTSATNTLSNTNNTIAGTTLNTIESSNASGIANRINASGASGSNDITSAGGNNNILSGTGKNILNSITGSNEIQIAGTPRITVTGSLTTLSNTAHTINGVTTFNVPPISATAPTSGSQLTNKTYVDLRALDSVVVHKTGNLTESIDGFKTFTNLTTTEQAFLIRKTFTYEQYHRFGSVLNNTFYDFKSGGNSADYDVRVNSIGGNIGSPFGLNGYGNYTVEAGTNTMDTKITGANYIKIGGNSKITTTSNNNTITNETNNIISTAGNNTMDASTGSVNNFQVAGVSKLTVGSTAIAINPTTQTTIYAGGTSLVDMTLSRTKMSSTTVDVEGVLISPTYRVGTYASSERLFGILYLNQGTTVIGVGSGASVPMSIGGVANIFTTQQGVFPFDCIVYYATFLSDNSAQATSRNIFLEVNGGATAAQTVSVNCPTGTNYRSLAGTFGTPKVLYAGNAYYFQLYMDGASATPKWWNVQLFYQQVKL